MALVFRDDGDGDTDVQPGAGRRAEGADGERPAPGSGNDVQPSGEAGEQKVWFV